MSLQIEQLCKLLLKMTSYDLYFVTSTWKYVVLVEITVMQLSTRGKNCHNLLEDPRSTISLNSASCRHYPKTSYQILTYQEITINRQIWLCWHYISFLHWKLFWLGDYSVLFWALRNTRCVSFIHEASRQVFSFIEFTYWNDFVVSAKLKHSIRHQSNVIIFLLERA